MAVPPSCRGGWGVSWLFTCDGIFKAGDAARRRSAEVFLLSLNILDLNLDVPLISSQSDEGGKVRIFD